jgi:hypothetical protein
MPKQMKERAIRSHMHPAAGWFMREQVEGRIPMTLGHTPVHAQAKDSRAILTLADRAGAQTTRSFDHVIAATGYRVNLERVPFLATDLALADRARGNIRRSFRTISKPQFRVSTRSVCRRWNVRSADALHGGRGVCGPPCCGAYRTQDSRCRRGSARRNEATIGARSLRPPATHLFSKKIVIAEFQVKSIT